MVLELYKPLKMFYKNTFSLTLQILGYLSCRRRFSGNNFYSTEINDFVQVLVRFPAMHFLCNSLRVSNRKVSPSPSLRSQKSMLIILFSFTSWILSAFFRK